MTICAVRSVKSSQLASPRLTHAANLKSRLPDDGSYVFLLLVVANKLQIQRIRRVSNTKNEIIASIFSFTNPAVHWSRPDDFVTSMTVWGPLGSRRQSRKLAEIFPRVTTNIEHFRKNRARWRPKNETRFFRTTTKSLPEPRDKSVNRQRTTTPNRLSSSEFCKRTSRKIRAPDLGAKY